MPVSTATTKPNRRKRELLETTAFPGGAVPLPSSEPEYVTQQEHEEKGTSASQSDETRPKYGGHDFDSRIGHNRGPPLHDVEPLAVRPSIAWRLLDCGNTHGYELIAVGELESYLDGRSRRITMRSIRAYIARRLTAAAKAGAPSEAAPQPRRRRGRPRKRAITAEQP